MGLGFANLRRARARGACVVVLAQVHALSQKALTYLWENSLQEVLLDGKWSLAGKALYGRPKLETANPKL